MKVMKRYAKRLAPVAAALALVAGQAATASAAVNSVTVTPSTPTAGAAGATYTWSWTGYQTATIVKCVKITFSINGDGSGGKPTNMGLGSATIGGTYFGGTGGTWTVDGTNAATGVLVYNNATATTAPSAGPLNVTVGAITNPDAGPYYMTIATYNTAGSGAGNCNNGTNLDPAYVSAFSVQPDTVVSAIVDPSFNFTVANKNSACNGESNYVDNSAGSAAALPLGHLGVASNASSGQTLTVTSNAGSGFSVYLRGGNATGNMRNAGNTYQWRDVVGSYPAGAALGAGERFGFTFKDSTTSSSVTNPAATNFIALDNTDRAVMGSATSQGGSGCVSYDAQTGANASSVVTPAGTYAATILYTAVPTF